MAAEHRVWRRWRIGAAVGGALLLALLTGLAGPAPAYAHDDDDDDNETVTTGPNACTTIFAPPASLNATCVQHETEQERGGVEVKDTYTTQAAPDAARSAFEAAFRQNGWTVVASEMDAVDQEWEYTITQGTRRVEVTVEAGMSAQGAVTWIDIKEHTAAAAPAGQGRRGSARTR
ncbi:MAG TPA: hypothetical protein VNL77_08975 [Roseiflexaceae bacterium]|nr:hypothetical protein [Roseiflexaceae bacterium]